MKTCLFCSTGKAFNTIEHIIPESLGNNDMVLEREICDACQNYLSQIENYVLNKTPIGFWRTLLTIKTKKGKLPLVDFNKNNISKGALPDYHEAHDNVAFEAHKDFTTELKPSGSLADLMNNNSGQICYVITPKVIHEVGRFLGKIGIELICYQDSCKARGEEFNSIRKYVREGSLQELWPIFYATKGDIKDLFTYHKADKHIEETVICYSYCLIQIADYIVLSFTVGLDNWFICLNQKFPHPEISRYMGENVKTIWYSKKQWKKQ